MRLTKKLSTITSVLALGSVTLSPAYAAQEAEPSNVEAPAASPIQSPAAAQISFERPAVTTTPAPAVVEQFADPVPQATTPQAPVQPKATAPLTKTAITPEAPAAKAPAAPTAQSVTAPASGKGAIIASAALAQLGIAQDCTALVSNSLSAAGIYFHGWPADYLSLGRVVSGAEAQPGDLIYYATAGAGVPHIAVYIGNGQAVHGGFNGSTVVFSAYQGSGPVFIRV